MSKYRLDPDQTYLREAGAGREEMLLLLGRLLSTHLVHTYRTYSYQELECSTLQARSPPLLLPVG